MQKLKELTEELNRQFEEETLNEFTEHDLDTYNSWESNVDAKCDNIENQTIRLTQTVTDLTKLVLELSKTTMEQQMEINSLKDKLDQ